VETGRIKENLTNPVESGAKSTGDDIRWRTPHLERELHLQGEKEALAQRGVQSWWGGKATSDHTE